MEFAIVKNTLPNYKRIFSGRDQAEVERFADHPRPFSVRIRGWGDEGADDVIHKLRSGVVQELAGASPFPSNDVKVMSINKTTGGRGIAEVMLSPALWRHSFEPRARTAWFKLLAAKAAERKRRANARKRLQATRLVRQVATFGAGVRPSRKSNPLRNVLVKFISDGGKLRARACGGGLNPHWNVSFPRNLRQLGAQYVVERIEVANNFYRAKGKLTRVV